MGQSKPGRITPQTGVEQIRHNDLNADNILVKRLSQEEIQIRRSASPFILKIVDTGSAVFRESFKHRQIDDLAFVGHHSNALLLAARRYQPMVSREDEFFLDNVQKIISSLLDEDPSRRIPTAHDFSVAVTGLYRERYILSNEGQARLTSPFEFLNANDFPTESFIGQLFSDLFPWVRDTIVPAAQSMLITGPRGSGKTMILRSMRLKTRLTAFDTKNSPVSISQKIEGDPFVAFFISARLEIGNHAPLSKLPKWMEIDTAILDYFHLLYAYEICDTLYYGMLKNILTPDPAAEYAFFEFLSETLARPVTSLPGALTAIKTCQAGILSLQDELSDRKCQIPATFLASLCGHLRLLFPFCADKRFVFLLDDFSLPKIPERVQRVLLPIIWNSGGGYTFRVSAHSEGMKITDTRSNVYMVNRDYKEINLGAAYINSVDIEDNREVVDACVNEIFDKRFALSGLLSKTNVKRILGNSPIPNIAREIKRRAAQDTLRGLRFCGWDTVISLCSGDISYVIVSARLRFEG